MTNLNKNVLLLFAAFFSPTVLLSQILSPPQPNQKGLERTFRKEKNWDWGTCGHGSFEDALRLFDAQNKIVTYNEGKIIYRVFSIGNKNYVEMNCGWVGGIYTYTTNSDSTIETVQLPQIIETKQSITADDEKNKVIRKNDNWSWGTYDHGSFDQAAQILKEKDNIVSFTDPNNKIKYRVFSHGTLNFVEIDYGWNGGIFPYTTDR